MLHGLKYDFIEDLLINLRLLKPPPAVLAENGVMRYRIGQRKTNKPTVGDVDPDFLNEASFRTNSVQITDQKHFEQHDRIDARTPIILTIQGAAFFRDKRKVDGFIDFSKQVILGNKVFYVDCFGLKFPGWVRPEHIKTFLRNCFIPNSTKKAVDPSLSTASGAAKAAPPVYCMGGCDVSPRAPCPWSRGEIASRPFKSVLKLSPSNAEGGEPLVSHGKGTRRPPFPQHHFL